MPHLDRRKRHILYRSAISIAIVLLLFSGGIPIEDISQGQPTTSTPIKHLIILMMENHSFDNLFGVYGKLSNGSMSADVTQPVDLTNYPLTENVTAVSEGTFTTSNPYEGFSQYHTDWNQGKMNGFLQGSGPSSLLYYGVTQAGLEWYLAKQYSIGDMYFSSTLSMTLPNRLISLTGFSPVKQDQNAPPPYALYSQSIFSEMDHYGVSWGYYFRNASQGIEPLQFLYGMNSHMGNVGSWGRFISEVQNDTLPDVSWVSPIAGGTQGCSQHPPNNILWGEMWIFYIVNLIMHSNLWNSSAIMITYDEGGGYYDQVAPPAIGGNQLGFRVPFIMVSPYAKEDHVSSTILTHTSILAFIDYNWGMVALNSLVSESNIPLDMFDFTASYAGGNIARSPLVFNPTLEHMLPASLTGSIALGNQVSNVSSAFSQPFQYPVSRLPYNHTSNSSVNLSISSSQVFVQNDTVYVPTPILIYTAGVAAGFAVIMAIFAYYHRRRKKL